MPGKDPEMAPAQTAHTAYLVTMIQDEYTRTGRALLLATTAQDPEIITLAAMGFVVTPAAFGERVYIASPHPVPQA